MAGFRFFLIMSMWLFEDKSALNGYRAIAGVDEAGRGPLAGPVVSAAVILPAGFSCPGLTDSKKVTPLKREKFHEIIMECAVAAATAISTVNEIESINILQASLLSMKRAVKKLNPSPDYLLIDGKFTLNYLYRDYQDYNDPTHDYQADNYTHDYSIHANNANYTGCDYPIRQQAIVKGDSRSISIAAASILAKVTRDRLMDELHVRYPEYGFNRHRGYPTKAHKAAIAQHGLCPVHRRTFKGVKEFCLNID